MKASRSDPAGGPADPGDVRRHLGRRRGGFSLLWLVAPFVRFLAPCYILQRERLITRWLQSARLRGPRPRRADSSCCSPRPGLLTRSEEAKSRIGYGHVNGVSSLSACEITYPYRVTCPRVSSRDLSPWAGPFRPGATSTRGSIPSIATAQGSRNAQAHGGAGYVLGSGRPTHHDFFGNAFSRADYDGTEEAVTRRLRP